MCEILAVGYNDFMLLGEGWHERSVDARSGVVYRPSKARAEFWLNVSEKHKAINLLLSASPTLIREKINFRLTCGDKTIGETRIEDDDWHLVKFPLPAEVSAEGKQKLKFTLSVSPTFIPHLVLHNGDFRELGGYLSAVRLLKE